MNNTTSNIYRILQDILRDIWEQQQYSELKNGVLLTLNVAIFAIILRMYFQVKELISSNSFNKIIFFILILIYIIHIFLILKSFFPKHRDNESNNINIFFFGDIQKVTSKDYLDLVIKKIESEDTETINKDYLLDLSNQIVKLSEITQFKYTSFKKSIDRMYGLGILFFIYFSWLFFGV